MSAPHEAWDLLANQSWALGDRPLCISNQTDGQEVPRYQDEIIEEVGREGKTGYHVLARLVHGTKLG